MDTLPQVLSELEAFSKDLAAEDELGSVVRAHIRIESILIALVESRFPLPDSLKRINLEFDGYVSLLLALGLAKEWGPALQAMGKLRNRFAHRIDARLDVQTVNNLYDTLPPNGKQEVHASLNRIRSRDPAGQALPGKYNDLPEKGKFQLIALTIWADLKGTQLRGAVLNGA
jgi:hypothetical protein